MDMAGGIELELRDAANHNASLGTAVQRDMHAAFAVRLLKQALQYGPLSPSLRPEWYNDDVQFGTLPSPSNPLLSCPRGRFLLSARHLAPLSSPARPLLPVASAASAMQQVLYLQKAINAEAPRLLPTLDQPLLNFRGVQKGSPARTLLLAGWVRCRLAREVAIDLRDSEVRSRTNPQTISALSPSLSQLHTHSTVMLYLPLP